MFAVILSVLKKKTKFGCTTQSAVELAPRNFNLTRKAFTLWKRDLTILFVGHNKKDTKIQVVFCLATYYCRDGLPDVYKRQL